jgi:hypothetical protein
MLLKDGIIKYRIMVDLEGFQKQQQHQQLTKAFAHHGIELEIMDLRKDL